MFHPRGLPGGDQYIYVYGTKGAVNLMGTPTMFALPGKSEPAALVENVQKDDPYAHLVAFYNSILNGAEPPADITIGATAALTAILGHQAMTRQEIVDWNALGVEV